MIPTCYFSSYKNMMYGGTFPCVVKIGSAHAGMGKMIIEDHHKMEDFRSVLAMTEGKYCTAEEFVAEPLYDLRIQRIGPHIRTFRRVSASGSWKTNTGTSMLEHVEKVDAFLVDVQELSSYNQRLPTGSRFTQRGVDKIAPNVRKSRKYVWFCWDLFSSFTPLVGDFNPCHLKIQNPLTNLTIWTNAHPDPT